MTELAGAMHDFGEQKDGGKLAFKGGGREMTHLTHAFNRMISDRNQAEEALRESEERFRELAELLPEVVFECDAQGNLTFVNEVAFDRFGYARKDFDKGVNALQFIAPDDRKRAGENIERTLRGIGKDPFEYIAQRKDGSEFSIIVFSSPIVRDGKPVGLRGLIVDITARKLAEKALRESEQKYRGIFDSTTDSLLVFNMKGEIVEANPRACEMYGYEYGELTRLTGKDIVHPDHYHILENLKCEVQTAGEFQTESMHVHKDGTSLDVEVKGTKLDFKGKPHLLAILRDISERKRADEERERLMLAIEQATDTVVITD
ncbi:MAG: PAS domain-containing protein, partial [Spirochaetaceae bacterium]|nr:PAS domain-containing protein [Spirochaetaceae bacterium]